MSGVYRTFMLAPQPANSHRFIDTVNAALEARGAELIGPGRGAPALWLFRCPFRFDAATRERLGDGTPLEEATTLRLTYIRGMDLPGFAKPVAMEIDVPMQQVLTEGDPELQGANFRWVIGALEHLFSQLDGLVSCSGPEEESGEDVLNDLVDPLLTGEAVTGPQLIHVGPAFAGRVNTAAATEAGARVERLPGGGLRLEFAPPAPHLSPGPAQP